MVNLKDMIVSSGLFKTIRIDGLLFVRYECLVESDQSSIWSHENYLAYVIGGKKMWRTPGKDYLASSGDALFIPKGAHTVYQYFDEKFYVIFIFLPDDFISRTLIKYPGFRRLNQLREVQGEPVFRLAMDPVMETCFQSILSFFLVNTPPPIDLLRLKMEELILSLVTRPGNELLKSYLIGLGQRQKSDLREIMETHYFHPLSISDFARLSARSLSAFRRDFKSIYGMTPGKWLMEKRLTYSRFLLETSDHAVSDIADECGFRNRSHFIRTFRETFGSPPNRFRMKSRSF